MSTEIKKQIWRDSAEPPKNYIWIKIDKAGNELGTYEYNFATFKWVKIVPDPNNYYTQSEIDNLFDATNASTLARFNEVSATIDNKVDSAKIKSFTSFQEMSNYLETCAAGALVYYYENNSNYGLYMKLSNDIIMLCGKQETV